jgi:hypothetical protein
MAPIVGIADWPDGAFQKSLQRSSAGTQGHHFCFGHRESMAYFAGAGQKAGIEIWRIEKLHAVRYPEDQYGQFFSGDSYLVLKVHFPNFFSSLLLAFNIVTCAWTCLMTDQQE